MTDLAVTTSGLTKRYSGDVLAVDGVELRVTRGEIYAFLGLNGAGKSTTIRMLLGMIRPTAGHAELFGERVRAGASGLWRRVGHLVESATAYPELTVRENLDVARRLSGVVDGRVVDRVIDRLVLDTYADRRAGTLSLGDPHPDRDETRQESETHPESGDEIGVVHANTSSGQRESPWLSISQEPSARVGGLGAKHAPRRTPSPTVGA
jgi:ABC-type lipopolysaccharide export system ATPase subunit